MHYLNITIDCDEMYDYALHSINPMSVACTIFLKSKGVQFDCWFALDAIPIGYWSEEYLPATRQLRIRQVVHTKRT